ncbi:MAG: zinc ribbon domain-containing protein, partial [Alphaproteobacteria bacterium]|nr:zinc ribbon domain-containing protein [Alphaproteobacteria bacterium]
EGSAMPTYEYRCEPCLKIYQVNHSMSETPKILCPECDRATERLISAPNLSLGGHTSPTAARYAKMTMSEEIAREKELQKTYETIWLPEEVKR